MPTIYDSTNPRVAEIGRSNAFREWAQVLARPAVFRTLTRMPSREQLLRLLDEYQPFAHSRLADVGAQGYVSGADEPLVGQLADRMGVLLAQWSPPELGTEIVETARALL